MYLWFSALLQTKRFIIFTHIEQHFLPSRKKNVTSEVDTSASNKKSIKECLLTKNITFETNLLKATLNQYKIDIAKILNKIVSKLPPYHSELNPIELS